MTRGDEKNVTHSHVAASAEHDRDAQPHDHTHHGHPHDHDHARDATDSTQTPDRCFTPNREQGGSNHTTALVEGDGRGHVLFFDASSGIAGDMTIASLVHLGVPFSVIKRAVESLGLAGCQVSVQSGRVGAIGACKFDVQATDNQHERHYGEIVDLIHGSSLSAGVIDLATRIFHRLAQAEARVHDIPIERVHFHEVGAIDAIADIVGSAAAIEYLGAEVMASPLPLGHGFVHCRHGVIPLPAPATVECLRGVPTFAAGIEAETVTPTGAAIIATVSKRFTRWPQMMPERVGWGAGTHRLPDRPNVLRVVLGKVEATHQTFSHGHVVIEANVDDMTGELAGYVLSLLIQSGALDAWAVPITMKKGRPGVILSAIVAPEDSVRLSEVMLRETTTLGVRRTETTRSERPRRVIDVSTRYGSVIVKVAEGPFGPVQLKPEFDDCVRIAQQHQVPVREVIAEALTKARIQLLGT